MTGHGRPEYPNYKNEDDYRAFVLETFANEKVRVAKLRQRGLLE